MSDSSRGADESAMRIALDEARKGTPSPNPHVGAVVVSAGEIVGRGFHARRGREHAEVAALLEAGERARGGTLYVTLEPCNHHGRTPPCTDAILASGVARVVIGVADPNPHVTGGGAARLRAAGLAVVEDVERDACARMIAPFAKHVRTGRPFVRLKLAASIDGRIAAAPHPSRPDAPGGVSKWITGPAARRRVHALRAQVDAVAVGIGTALADDPELTVRDVAPLEGRDAPARVVFDTRARLPLVSKLVRSARETQTFVVAADDADPSALEAEGVHVLRVGLVDGRLDLGAALDALGRASIVDLLVEGGSQLAGALVAADQVDELHWFVAPIALGDRGAPSLVGLAPSAPDVAPRYALESTQPCGDDVELVLVRISARAPR